MKTSSRTIGLTELQMKWFSLTAEATNQYQKGPERHHNVNITLVLWLSCQHNTTIT